MSGKALSASNNGDKLAKKVTQHGANFPGKMRTFPLDISMRECLQAPADFLKVHGSLVFFLSIHDCFDSSLCVEISKQDMRNENLRPPHRHSSLFQKTAPAILLLMATVSNAIQSERSKASDVLLQIMKWLSLQRCWESQHCGF